MRGGGSILNTRDSYGGEGPTRSNAAADHSPNAACCICNCDLVLRLKPPQVPWTHPCAPESAQWVQTGVLSCPYRSQGGHSQSSIFITDPSSSSNCGLGCLRPFPGFCAPQIPQRRALFRLLCLVANNHDRRNQKWPMHGASLVLPQSIKLRHFCEP